MVKTDRRYPALLQVASSLCFLYVTGSAWISTSQSTLDGLAPLVWSVGAIAAFNLLFISVLGLVLGVSVERPEVARYSVWVASVALGAMAAGYANLGGLPLQGGVGYPQGSVIWLGVVVLGFGLGWLGTNWQV